MNDIENSTTGLPVSYDHPGKRFFPVSVAEFSGRVKHHPISRRFLSIGTRVALAAAILTPAALADNAISKFVRPVSANGTGSADITSIPTWRNRCGVNAHVPNHPEQSIYNTRIVFMFAITPDQIQNLEQEKTWFNQNVKDRIQVVHDYYLNMMGVNVTYDGAAPTTESLPNTLEFYKNNTPRFTSDSAALPMIKSTTSEFIINSRVYASDPSKGLHGAFPPGAWSGNIGTTGISEIPLALFDPKLSDYDKRLAYNTFLHDLVGHPFFGPNHSSDPQNVMYAVANPDFIFSQLKVSEENLINTCPPGDPDPAVNPNLKPSVYLAVTIKN